VGTRALIASLLGLVIAAAPASAHDFWLYPKTHVPEKPGTVEIRIFLGMMHDVSEMERRPAHFKRFEAHGAAGVIDTQGRAGAKPGGFLDLPANDIYTLIYESRHGYIRLDAEKFTRYLADEGLPQILSERLRRGETDKPGDEGFARYVKALIKVGDADTGYDRRIGMQSELVALTNPFVGGGIAPIIAGGLAANPAYGLKGALYFAAAGLAVGFVVALFLKETAPRKTGLA
jgi:hypothetical protein